MMQGNWLNRVGTVRGWMYVIALAAIGIIWTVRYL
ncbi:hypothetical protein BDD14_6283 [Edaphobacter modestus]|uniref:Uncharacterized protein n=1 Tax=Edaphobacter modestus TaxID=388466 RepID=A0A4Q7Y200_9BACT|nr:hypothetical protein BDD14_6283 [Edaphobacter modestus]